MHEQTGNQSEKLTFKTRPKPRKQIPPDITDAVIAVESE